LHQRSSPEIRPGLSGVIDLRKVCNLAMLLATLRASSIVSTLAMSASAFVSRPNKLLDKMRTGAREVSKMTLKEALALRLPNGTRLGDASPDELKAEAARLATVAEAIKNGTPETTTKRIERKRIALFKEAFRLINEKAGR